VRVGIVCWHPRPLPCSIRDDALGISGKKKKKGGAKKKK